MANTKKYVSLDKLSLYDGKIKEFLAAADGVTLKSAKDYADSLASNYDAAGAAGTAETNAKAYTDGQITTVNGTVAGVKTIAEQGVADAAKAQAAADKAQGEVDALETYVGTIPSTSSATDVIGYVVEKTSGIASEGAMTELAGRVTTVEGKVATIEADYLKGTDKTELAGDIADVQAAVDAEKGRAEGVEAGFETRIKTIEDDYLVEADKTALQGSIDGVDGRVAEIEKDYLVEADKTALQGAIDLKVAQADYDAKMEEIDDGIDGLQTQIDTIMNNPDTEGVINSINEFTQYIADHGEIADGFRADIDKNKTDIAAEVKRAGEAEIALSGRIDTLAAIDHEAYKAADEVLAGRIKTLEDIDHEAYVAADTALKTELNGEIAKKADTTALEAAVEALEGVDAGFETRIAAVEGKLGTGEGSVATMIATAKQEAIDSAVGTAAADATSKANTAESNAKGHADGLNTAMNARVEALEAIDHDHANKAELDLIASGDKAKWDTAAGKAHEHGNKDVLDGITSENIATWNTVTSKAAQSDLTAVGNRVTAIETWHANFVEVSEEEINGLFQQ